MISRNKIKTIKSLEYKKYRLASGLFLAEGKKLVSALLNSEIRIETLIATPQNLASFQPIHTEINEITEASEEEIRQASLLKNPQGCLALCRIPAYRLPVDEAPDNLILCLDKIQDPGNLGTMVRIADWFNLADIVCSSDTADVYNPKVIQATMGSISRVRVHYTGLYDFLQSSNERKIQIFGTLLDGENIYSTSLPAHGMIVLGNEGNGISNDLLPYINRKITIPDFSMGRKTAESLNVSVAAAIVISEFRRRIL